MQIWISCTNGTNCSILPFLVRRETARQAEKAATTRRDKPEATVCANALTRRSADVKAIIENVTRRDRDRYERDINMAESPAESYDVDTFANVP